MHLYGQGTGKPGLIPTNDRQVFSCTHDDFCTQPWIWLHVHTPSFFAFSFHRNTLWLVCSAAFATHQLAHSHSPLIPAVSVAKVSQTKNAVIKKPKLETEVKDRQEMKKNLYFHEHSRLVQHTGKPHSRPTLYTKSACAHGHFHITSGHCCNASQMQASPSPTHPLFSNMALCKPMQRPLQSVLFKAISGGCW